MNNLTCARRLLPLKRTNLHIPVYLHLTSWRNNDKSDEEKDTKKSQSKAKNEEALNKLNSLLKKMVESDLSDAARKLDLAKPKRTREVKTVKESEQTLENKIVTAAKDVAHSLGGDVQQTKSELLSKLLSSSAENNSDKQTVSTNLSEIIKGMRIERETKTTEEISRANQVRALLQQVKSRSALQSQRQTGENYPRHRSFRDQRFDLEIEREKIDLFGNDNLGIFSVHDKPQEEMNKTWKMLHERELALAVTHPPSNYFQQMILWTQQGKIWKFPIDNEQGMEDEQSIYFTEHIFLEKHLEPWCPSKGPIRHFMELVCVGLSKNPYMSVEHKKGHIAWYRDYFTDKKQLLQEVGAIPSGFELSKQEEPDKKLE